ncbi:MAG: NAD-dependent epimerase/dehydratase family protein, partial [Opitutaceae bacterium]|nr:NAD-dependent epimerase/dehydratase family protein [Verrucomicrobiales bacterium]
MATYLVTGGAGFIGSHLAERLVRDGHQVRILDNLSSGRLHNLTGIRDRIEFIQGDGSVPDLMDPAARGVDGIFHLAAIPSVPLSIKDPVGNLRSGEAATLAVIHAARQAGVRRVVFSSSSAIYGDTGLNQNSEELPPNPLSFYALSKLNGEEYNRLYSRLFAELDTVSLRYFNVFGPRQDPSSPYSGVISIFMKCLIEQQRPTIYGDGSQRRDFVEVSDVVQANLLAMSSTESFRGDTFNVGTGESVTILEIWNQLKKLAQSDLEPQFAAPRLGDIRNSCASIAK